MSTIPWVAAPSRPIDEDGPVKPFSAFDPVEGPETPILALIAARAAADPGRIAIQDESRAVSYADVMAEAAALAACVAATVPAGEPVGIRLRDNAHGPIAFLACLAAATPAILLDRADPADRLAAVASANRIAAIITEDDIPGYRCIRPGARPAAAPPDRMVGQGAPAFIVLTSGSTGQPKGIVHTQRSVLHRAGLLVNSGHLAADDRYLSLNTPASMGALLNAIAAFLAGATLHRVDLSLVGLGGVLRRIRDHRITAMIGVPAIYRTLARPAAAAALTSVRLVSSNGEALLAADLALLRACLKPDCAIQMVYGATETQAGMRFIPHSEMPAEPQVAAGRPIPGTGFAILDDDGSPVGPGETGELHIRSRYTAIGEWRDGQSVAGRLIPDDIECEAEAGPIWRRYAMGDLVRMRPDGAIVVAGRRDRQLKLNGYRVEPVEVEALLRADSDVLDAIVLPLAGPAGPELIAFVAAAPDGRAEAHARLLALLSARMPAHMRPRRLHLLEALPLLPSNKIDAGALARLDASSRPAGGAVH